MQKQGTKKKAPVGILAINKSPRNATTRCTSLQNKDLQLTSQTSFQVSYFIHSFCIPRIRRNQANKNQTQLYQNVCSLGTVAHNTSN
jgi:hypothetical protein